MFHQFARRLQHLAGQLGRSQPSTMDEAIQTAIRNVEAAKKPSVPWKANEPVKQPFYIWSNDKGWTATLKSTERPRQPVRRIALFSWNIDFMLPFADSRMSAALAHLKTHIDRLSEDVGVVIFLQECVASDLKLVASQQWIRDSFALSDLDTSNWTSGYYGTITLSRGLSISSCFRVHYEKTRMERDAFFTDYTVNDTGNAVRVCNTHLESLALEPPMRPAQMQLVAEYMHDESVLGAVVAGDFNAIQPFDRTLHSDNNLKDAYLELGGQEDTDDGYTWGQQAATSQRQKFGCSRMDKVYFCGGGLKVHRFNRFGADIVLSDEDEGSHLIKLGFEKAWITDHLGIMAEFGVEQHERN